MDPLMSSCQQQREGSALLCFILDVLKKEKKTFIMAAHRTQLSGGPFGSSENLKKTIPFGVIAFSI